MPRSFARSLLPLLGVVLLSAGPLRAQDDRAKARALFGEGQAEYNLGHFAKALEHYESAYKIKAVPALLFNIAQCHRQLGDMRSAANTYKAYLRTAADKDPNRVKAEALLAEVEGAVKKNEEAQYARPLGAVPKAAGEDEGGKAVATDHDAPPQVDATATSEGAAKKDDGEPKAEQAALREAGEKKAPAAGELAAALPRSPGSAPSGAVQSTDTQAPQKSGRTLTWVAAGGTGLALAGGAFFGLKSKSTASELQGSAHEKAVIDQKKAQVASDAGKANLMFGVGAALAAATAAFFVLEF